MKAHTNRFKEEIGSNGRQLDSIITYQLNGVTQILTSEDLNGVTPTFQGAILKSVMKQLDIDSNVLIPIGTILNYKFGVKVNGEYEYLDFGNYIVKDIEKQEDTNSYKITCYDKMLLSMKEYAKMPITYPITIRDYINSICTFLGLSFANINDTFVNYNKTIPAELYLDSDGNSIGYTFRDVFDELAQATASTICINENDEVEVRYINDTGDIINEEYLKDINVNFGERYGKVNSIVLSRSGESDNIYLRDETSVAENGLCELKIIDNQIMNFNNRDEFLPEILGKLNGLEYYLNDYSSTGIAYYDLCDRYSVQIGDNIYSCVMFNDEILITQGLKENVFTEMPEENETDYTKSDKTDRKINQTYLIVDKQNQQIEAVISQTEKQKQQLAQVTQNINNIQNLFQITGGSNLIKNSQGLLDDDVWNEEEKKPITGYDESDNPIYDENATTTFIKGYDGDLAGRTIAVAKLGISNGKMSTKNINITNLLVENRYTLNYFITNEKDTTTTIRLIGHNVIYEKIFDEECEMQDEIFEFIADTSNYVLEIESTSLYDNFVYIYDLMLNSGDKKSWEPSTGEIVGTVIKLSQLGLQIYCTGSNIATLLTAQGFQVRRFQNGQLYEVITEFTDKGIITNQITYMSDNMDGLIHKTIQSDGYKKYISYIGGDN